MGYTTDFTGRVTIEPPLNESEITYLRDFNESRRMGRENGPYFVKGSGEFGQGHDDDIKDFNRPPEGQPGLWCQWTVTDDGKHIEWDGGEKFYHADQWMKYLIDHFLTGDHTDAELKKMVDQDPRFANFTFDHVVNGEIEAQGEEYDDRWFIRVKDNEVLRADAVITMGEPRPVVI